MNILHILCDDKANGPVSQFDEKVFDLRFEREAFSGWSFPPRPEPPATATTKSGEELIAEALESLSLDDRSRVERELHGVFAEGQQMMETAKFQQTHLDLMEQHLTQLRSESGWNLQLAALDIAEGQNPEYVKNPDFRLRFLRSDNWDAKKAASRFVSFFDLKLELFGEAKLSRNIRLSDLQPSELALLKKGYLQRLSVRDRAGRVVLCTLYNGQSFPSPDCVARVYFYFICALDEESCRNGIVTIDFKIGEISFDRDGDDPSNFNRLLRATASPCLPSRTCGMHKFMAKDDDDESGMRSIINNVVGKMTTDKRSRVRLHRGTYTEWMYDLLCVGIPQHVVPITSDLKLKTKNHLEYPSMRSKSEEIEVAGSSLWTTDLPSHRDVLLGKGKPTQDSTGNKMLSKIIDELLSKYQAASKMEKTALSASVILQIQAKGGKFLSKEIGIWTEASDMVAREKVSHMFRHQLQKANKKKASMASGVKSLQPHLSVEPRCDSSSSSRPFDDLAYQHHMEYPASLAPNKRIRAS